MKQRVIEITGIHPSDIIAAAAKVALALEDSGEVVGERHGLVRIHEDEIAWIWNPDPYEGIHPGFLRKLEQWNGNLNNIEVAMAMLRDDFINALDTPMSGRIECDVDPGYTVEKEYLSPADAIELFYGAESMEQVREAYETLEGEIS